MVEGSSTEVVEQGRLDTILVPNKDKLAKSRRFMDAPTRRVVSSTFIITPTKAFLRGMLTKW